MAGIDDKSHEILRVLTHDGRISNVDLAAAVNLSPSACLRRVQELERAGIITGYRACLDREALARAFIAYLGVGLSLHDAKSQQNFECAIAELSQVVECHNVTGSFEYLLRVECEDIASYKRFHTDILGNIPLVASIITYVVLGSPKDMRQ